MSCVQESLYGVQLSTVKVAARGQLSRTLVVDRALALADDEGLDAVTIRRLATELDVTPMALYWHFRTKDDLLASMADRLLDDVEIPAAQGSWPELLRGGITALVSALRPHPQVAPLVALRMVQHPTGLALTEMALGALDAAGFSTADAAQLAGHALTTAIVLVTGDQVDDSGSTAEREDELAAKGAFLRGLPVDRYPHVVAAAAALTHCDDVDRFYALGVDVFVAGLEGLARSGPARAHHRRAVGATRRRSNA
jgi:AcrR family transcriptional regulator